MSAVVKFVSRWRLTLVWTVSVVGMSLLSLYLNGGPR